MPDGLRDALSGFRDKVSELVKSKKSISVTTHTGCDGLAAGSIIAKALIRAGAGVTVRASKELDPPAVAGMAGDGRDFHIITDLGGGLAGELDGRLGDAWLVLDHHQIPRDEADNPRVVNAWKYGMDGGTEICAGGMAYLAAHAMDERNSDLSAAAVVSALGDRQDTGEGKALVGRNAEIAGAAEEEGLLEVGPDLLLAGRETRPLADALAFTSRPFVEGLTWRRDACRALLQSSGIPLKDGGRWRVPAELTEPEKRSLVEAVAGFAPGGDAAGMASELVGQAYTLPREDGRSFLRDGREFSTMLNSCGRIGKPGVGMAVCMGDRNRILGEGESVLAEYRGMIRGYMDVLASERWRTSEGGACVMVNGEGVVPEAMTGTVSSLIAGSPRNSGKIVILRTAGEGGGSVKFSSRKSPGCRLGVNLSELMRSGAERSGGAGGGHDAAAGARIAKDKLDGFLDYLEANVVKVQGHGDPGQHTKAEGPGRAARPGA